MPDSPPPQGLAPRTELYCVELRVSDWPRMLAWYRDRLGLRSLVRVEEDRYALLMAGATRISLVARPQAEPPSPRTTLVFEVDNVDAALARLTGPEPGASGASQGSTASEAPSMHAEGYRTLLVADPEGNRVRLIQWPPAEG
jgi:catechol 2,3-dioxygenase-like lactoylglutathione lyase family enzyme